MATFSVVGIPIIIQFSSVFPLLEGLTLSLFDIVFICHFNYPFKRFIGALIITVALALIGTVVHEIGHMVALGVLGIKTASMGITNSGMYVLCHGNDLCSNECEIVVSVAGPFFFLIFAAICGFMSRFSTGSSFSIALKAVAVYGLTNSIYNLMPWTGSDGGQIFNSISGNLLLSYPTISAVIQNATGILIGIAMSVWGAYVITSSVRTSLKGTT